MPNSATAPKQPRARRLFQTEYWRAMVAIWLAQTCTLASTYLLFLLPRMLNGQGVNLAWRGYIMATFTAAFMLGTLTGHYRPHSERRAVLIGTAMALGGCLTYTLGGYSLAAYFVARALHGFGCAWVVMTMQGWLLRTVSVEMRGKAIGLANLPGFAVMAFSPFVSEAITRLGPSPVVFYLAAALCALVLPLAWTTVPSNGLVAAKAEAVSDKMTRPELLVALFLFAHGFALSYALTLLPVLTDTRRGWVYSIFFLSYGVVAFVMRALVERFIARWVPARARAAAGTLVPFGLFLLSFVPVSNAYILVGVFFGMGHALFFPSLMQIATRRTSEKNLAIRVGKLTATGMAGTMLGECLSGMVAEMIGLHNACVVGGAMVFMAEIGLLVAILLASRAGAHPAHS